jgi:hypothetical protein
MFALRRCLACGCVRIHFSGVFCPACRILLRFSRCLNLDDGSPCPPELRPEIRRRVRLYAWRAERHLGLFDGRPAPP